MNPSESLYEADFHAWTQQQARLVEHGQWAEVDRQHLVEEIESMGRAERRELGSRLSVLLAHLLKWQYQPHLRGRSRELTIREQRSQVDLVLQDNPSLRASLDATLRDAYRLAVFAALRETGLPAFPAQCPYTRDQVMDDEFFPAST